jgi:hypothetical protein
MRHRDLAAIGVTATVAATPALATIVENVTSTSPAAADDWLLGDWVWIAAGCLVHPPFLGGYSSSAPPLARFGIDVNERIADQRWARRT